MHSADFAGDQLLTALADAIETEVLPALDVGPARVSLSRVRFLLRYLAVADGQSPDLVAEVSRALADLGQSTLPPAWNEAEAHSGLHDAALFRREELVLNRLAGLAGEPAVDGVGQLRTIMQPELSWALATTRLCAERANEEGTPSARIPSNEQMAVALAGCGTPVPGGVADVRPVGNGTSKDVFVVEPLEPGAPRYVVRRDPPSGPIPATVVDEFDLLSVLHAQGLPVPRMLAVEHRREVLGNVFVVMEWMEGTAAAERIGGRLDFRGNDPRMSVFELARLLVQIHSVDVSTLPGRYRYGSSPESVMASRIDALQGEWEWASFRPSPIVSASFAWLRRHMPDLGADLVLVHGDASLRNLFVKDDRAVAMLDWENPHLGCAWEDIGYARGDVEGIVPWTEFLNCYAAYGGTIPANVEEVSDYFAVWHLTQIVVWSVRGGRSFLANEVSDLRLADSGTGKYLQYIQLLAERLLAAEQARVGRESAVRPADRG